MSADEQRKLAAIMFTDMVGYSALSQRDEKLAQELLEEHRQLLREIFPRFNGSEIKTIGDAFLVEFNSALEAAQCAIEIQRALAKRNHDVSSERRIELKIGIHIGDVVHRGGDVYGDGVNIASRIEPLAGAGGICVSMDVERQIRNALEARFEKLAPTELKNISVAMELFRIVLPWEQQAAPAAKSETRSSKSEIERGFAASARLPWHEIVIGILLLAALIGGAMLWFHRAGGKTASGNPPATPSITEKSIAVLPFENLSSEEENAYFVDGVQDQILTDLAKIADLKVISRTSVMQYKKVAVRNLREIATQLGVAHVLEGSVQRAGGKVRVTAQLINALTDAHEWAENYDRPVDDVFAIQSEIAKKIADQLQAAISPREKVAMSQTPTTDLVANKLYLQAKDLLHVFGNDPNGKQGLLGAVRLLDEAVVHDPHFLLAYCLVARMNLELYWEGFDHVPARRELANTAIQIASRLQPDAGEVHLARADYAYHGFRDYDGARGELEHARSALPNDAEIYDLTALIDRRQGRWVEAMRNLERAVELDPLNFGVLSDAGTTAATARRYSDAARYFERAIQISPREYTIRTILALNSFRERADPRPLHALISRVLTEEPAAAQKIAFALFLSALVERDSTAMTRAMAFIPPEGMQIDSGNFPFPREMILGIVSRVFNDTVAAQSSFSAARLVAEKIAHDQPDYAPAWAALGLIDAGLGRKQEAVNEGRRACELLPFSRDAVAGPVFITNLATIYAWTGEKDAALEQLSISANIPGGVTFGDAKLNPQWDALRGDPRFEKIVASLAPK